MCVMYNCVTLVSLTQRTNCYMMNALCRLYSREGGGKETHQGSINLENCISIYHNVSYYCIGLNPKPTIQGGVGTLGTSQNINTKIHTESRVVYHVL